jgi:hypothetical protein
MGDDAVVTPIALRSEFDPFLLPLCQCGGATSLSHMEPHPSDRELQLRTFRCSECGAEQTFIVHKP